MSVLSDIHDAGQGLKLLSITYTAKNGEITNRKVEPYEVKEGRLYAFDPEKGGLRSFYVDKIAETSITDETFTPRWDIKI